jgi:hypothetical protein
MPRATPQIEMQPIPPALTVGVLALDCCMLSSLG